MYGLLIYNQLSIPLKTSNPYTLKSYVLAFLAFCFSFSVKAQGKVVINEYMPWSGCATTNEFIELLNFGPGPVNIGCYIVTNGKYSVTIPPNTILQPKQYYVLAGQDVLSPGCGNIDSAIKAQLNWNTCNCTNKPVPTTGDGFFEDGGNANEKVVLLDPNLNVIDAVTRSLPVSASTPITTPGIAAGCTGKVFNLDAMNIVYETLGMSTGKANSFARQVDGDCSWVKTPQQSANATNNTGSTSSTTYTLTITNSMDCVAGGSIDIAVNTSNYSEVFPMHYILAKDVDGNGMYTEKDQYINGIDESPRTISIKNLRAGRYQITVFSAKGCNLKSFDFTILECFGVLPVQLLSFYTNQSITGASTLKWVLDKTENLQQIIVEQSADGINFQKTEVIAAANSTGQQYFSYTLTTPLNYYRLSIYSKEGNKSYSPVISPAHASFALNKVYPNPVSSQLFASVYSSGSTSAAYIIYTQQSVAVQQGMLQLQEGQNQLSFNLQNLKPGLYQLMIHFSQPGQQPLSFKFVKQ